MVPKEETFQRVDREEERERSRESLSIL